MKRIIEIEESDLERIREIVERENKTALSVTTRGTAYITIADSKPYDDSGDLISREALKEHKVYSEERHEYVVPVYNIDNAQAIPLPSNQIAWEQGYEAGLAQGKQDNAPTVEPVIKCPDCKFYHKKWFVDRRMKEKGYWNCWCECHDYWVGGENGFCSLAEKKGGAE